MVKSFSALVIFCTLLIALPSYAQDNFKMSGTLTDIVNDALVVEYSGVDDDSEPIRFTVPIQNGRFSFGINIKDVCIATLSLLSDSEIVLPMTFVQDSEAKLNGTFKNQDGLTVSGSDFYEDLNAFNAFQKPYNDEFNRSMKLYEDAVIAGGDEESLVEQKNERDKAITERMQDAAYEHVSKNLDKESSVLYMVSALSGDQYLYLIEKLPSEVRNGHFRTVLDNFETQYISERNSLLAKKLVGSDKAVVGKVAPDIVLKDVNGQSLNLSSLRGKYVVLDFWGSWCSWCISSLPKLKEYYNKHRGEIEILGIACYDSEKAWKNAVRKHQIPWLNVWSHDAVTETRYDISVFPTIVVISPEGIVEQYFTGAGQAFYDYIDNLMSVK